MINRIVKKIVMVSGFVALATTATATFGSSAAFAGQITCAPNLIEYYNGTIIIQCAPTNYLGHISPPSGCPGGQFIDTLKAWTSMAQAALLSGKNVQIYYDTCGGVNTITALDLIK
jgi:hypothetical protein